MGINSMQIPVVHSGLRRSQTRQRIVPELLADIGYLITPEAIADKLAHYGQLPATGLACTNREEARLKLQEWQNSPTVEAALDRLQQQYQGVISHLRQHYRHQEHSTTRYG
jgi:hypothetical protein